MGSTVIETGYTSLNHFGEELCGDKVEMIYKNGYTTLVLADGLGSGVKANILSTLTSKILCTMIADGADIEDCVNTIIATLPVCKERQLAYSTFSIVKVDDSGKGKLFEFDNPEAIYYTNGKCTDFNRVARTICGKQVYESDLQLKVGDMVFLFSDGVVDVGEGMILKNSFMRPEIKKYLDDYIKPTTSPRDACCRLDGACFDIYVEKPMDDTTVASIKLRERKNVTVMVGPPVDRENCYLYVDKFLANEGMKIVCGGTTSHIVSERLNKPIDTNFDIIDSDVPPISKIDGIDIVTEGVLTLKKVKQLSDKYVSHTDLVSKNFDKQDGASLIMQALFEYATDILFYVGQSVNSAHTGSEIDSTIKLKLVEDIANNLKKVGKNVKIIYD